jgi:hypothetical protein
MEMARLFTYTHQQIEPIVRLHINRVYIGKLHTYF